MRHSCEKPSHSESRIQLAGLLKRRESLFGASKIVEFDQSQFQVCLSIAGHLGDFHLAEVAVETILPVLGLLVRCHTEVMDQKRRAAETQAAALDARPDAFVHSTDKINSRIAPEEAHVFVIDVCGKALAAGSEESLGSAAGPKCDFRG